MSINFTQRQTISAVEIGWSGISISEIVIGIPEGRINESYVKYLENRFGIKEGRFLRELREEFISDLPTMITAITGMCFREASNALYFKGVDKALSEKYQRTKAGIRGETVYREPSTKELIGVSIFNYDGKNRIDVSSTNKDVARRLLLERMVEIDNGFCIDTNKLTEGLENLSTEACPYGTIYWDSDTKGLIKTSSGHDLQIPDRIIEVTAELNIDAVVTYVRNYLLSHKLPS